MNCVRILALQKKCRVKFYQWLLASTGMSEAGGGGGRVTPPHPQISTKEGRLCPPNSKSIPSDFQTFRRPCYIQCHGQDMAISIMVTVHNNETILICSLIRLLNTALSSIFFPFKLSHFSTLTFERKHVHRAEISRERVSLQI